MTQGNPWIFYHASGPQNRVVMYGHDLIGFATSTMTAHKIIRALRAYEEDHECVSCPPARYRVGRSLGRTVYRMVGTEPSKDDKLLGLMDSREYGALVVAALNQYGS